ncbi:MAG: transposase [Prolixibacteraceae bacterium]|nr:transposase [Prolixibacteraceae bacterium]
MGKKRFSTTQIYNVLRENESGTSVSALVQKYGICQATIYNWRVKYQGLNKFEIDRFIALEKENDRLKRMYAELSLEYLNVKGEF